MQRRTDRESGWRRATAGTEHLSLRHRRAVVTDGDDSGTTAERVAQLHEHLAATAERPVERTASRWIGEAEAVAGDLVDADLDPAVLARRLGHVAALLENVEETGDQAAAEHVESARALADDLLAELAAGADERE
jgi:hypothetical protein